MTYSCPASLPNFPCRGMTDVREGLGSDPFATEAGRVYAHLVSWRPPVLLGVPTR